MCPKYARFDHTLDLAPVSWYDTDSLTYPNMPDARDLLVLTEQQWEDRLINPSGWAVRNGTDLVCYQAPRPLAAQVDVLVAQKRNGGIAITSSSSPGINATYAIDPVTIEQITPLAVYAVQFGDFPSGLVEHAHPDIAGAVHSFSVDEFVAFWRAVMQLLWQINAQADAMRAGGTPAWPEQSATLA